MKSIHVAVLVILDGFGYRLEKKDNAVAHAYMPHFNTWWKKYPHAILAASGTAVGLPDNMIGNSEVGHITIGAGRIISQPMKVWLDSIADGSFAQNAVLLGELEKLKNSGGALHIIGLLSDAGVHAHETQIYAVIDSAVMAGVKKIVVHPILDGRDVSPQSAYDYLEHLTQITHHYNNGRVIIGSLHGRFYAMDRDNNWDRIEKSYRVLTKMTGDSPFESWEKVLERNYAHSITDEFILPTQLNSEGVIHNGDGIVFCNVRPDRARELTQCFVQNGFEHFALKPLLLTFFITPVVYSDDVTTTPLFQRPVVRKTLKDVLAAHNKTIFTCAETEKYAHVTYFFRGENEKPVATETRQLIPSISVENYVHNPEMSAEQITQIVVSSLREDPQDFYLINYANADMVGHSGNFGATIKAVEFLDTQLGILCNEVVKKMNGTLYITADHGSAEDMFDEVTNQPRTAHTSNPVPFLMIKNGTENSGELELKELADIAPFILRNMGIEVPFEMKK
jgi:2,3-bisphosphoglycerate-independent phosphoglycerate mutase